MAATITVVCPECSNEIQAPADFAGKKVRCKGCGHVFKATPAPPRGAVARAPAGKPVSAKAPPVAPIMPEDDDEDANPYKVTTTKGSSRCPECANEMESEDAVICLHCGYNTITRERLALRKVHDTTALDRFIWLLPGAACAASVLLLIVFDLLYCLLMRPAKDGSWIYTFFSWSGTKMWVCIGTVFIMFLAGRFAVIRLLFHPNPPEVERH